MTKDNSNGREIGHQFIAAFIILLCLLTAGCSRSESPIEVNLGEDTTDKGRELIRKTGLDPNKIGYILYDPETGTVIQSHNRNMTFIPASVTKILTILAALQVFGPDHRFTTYLGYTGSIIGNQLQGDLYLRGTGDPLLTLTDLLVMVLNLRDQGITEITGNFYYDESELFHSSQIDSAMDDDAVYNPGLSALSLDYNILFAQWKKDTKNKTMKVRLIPELPINNAGISNNSPGEDIKFSYRNRKGKETWLLSPEVDRRGRTRLPVHNPGLYTAHMFKKIAGIYGITVKDPQPGTMPKNADTLFENKGKDLTHISDITLTYSSNIMAELLNLTTAKEITGKSLSLEESSAVLEEFFIKRVKNINWEGFNLVNGSGLTSQNRISPEQMLGILLYGDSQEYNGRPFISLLPASGWEWSLMSRLNNAQTAFYIWAKTGTINYAISLAGYLNTASNRRLLFVFFINDIEQREAYENNPDRRSKDSIRKAYRWINAQKSAMDTILEYWVRNF